MSYKRILTGDNANKVQNVINYLYKFKINAMGTSDELLALMKDAEEDKKEVVTLSDVYKRKGKTKNKDYKGPTFEGPADIEEAKNRMILYLFSRTHNDEYMTVTSKLNGLGINFLNYMFKNNAIDSLTSKAFISIICAYGSFENDLDEIAQEIQQRTFKTVNVFYKNKLIKSWNTFITDITSQYDQLPNTNILNSVLYLMLLVSRGNRATIYPPIVRLIYKSIVDGIESSYSQVVTDERNKTLLEVLNGNAERVYTEALSLAQAPAYPKPAPEVKTSESTPEVKTSASTPEVKTSASDSEVTKSAPPPKVTTSASSDPEVTKSAPPPKVTTSASSDPEVTKSAPPAQAPPPKVTTSSSASEGILQGGVNVLDGNIAHNNAQNEQHDAEQQAQGLTLAQQAIAREPPLLQNRIGYYINLIREMPTKLNEVVDVNNDPTINYVHDILMHFFNSFIGDNNLIIQALRSRTPILRDQHIVNIITPNTHILDTIITLGDIVNSYNNMVNVFNEKIRETEKANLKLNVITNPPIYDIFLKNNNIVGVMPKDKQDLKTARLDVETNRLLYEMLNNGTIKILQQTPKLDPKTGQPIVDVLGSPIYDYTYSYNGVTLSNEEIRKVIYDTKVAEFMLTTMPNISRYAMQRKTSHDYYRNRTQQIDGFYKLRRLKIYEDHDKKRGKKLNFRRFNLIDTDATDNVEPEAYESKPLREYMESFLL